MRILRGASLLTAAALAVLPGCGEKSENKKPAASQMTVTFLDVGKADAIVIKTAQHAVVIDCGEKGDGKEVVAELEEKGAQSVDALIVTHYDKDHVGGAAKVIKTFDVGTVYAPDYQEESEEMEKYSAALSGKGMAPTLLTEDVSFEYDGVKFEIMAPKQTFYGQDNDNDFSLVTRVTHGENVLLFTGDAMEQRLDEIMDVGSCTFLKIPYHGRKVENLGQFLDAVKPKCAVACTSQSEFASSVQKLLTDKGIRCYSTCFNGRIELTSDGKSLSFTTEK